MNNLLSAVVHGIGKKRKRDTGDSSDTGDDRDYNPDSSTDSDSSYQPKRTKTKSTRKVVTKTCSVKSPSAPQVKTHDGEAKVKNSRNTKPRSAKTKANDKKSTSAASGSSETKTLTSGKGKKSTTARASSSSRRTKTKASTSDLKTELQSCPSSCSSSGDSAGIDSAGTKTAARASSSRKAKTPASSSHRKAELPSSVPSNDKNDESTGIYNADTKTNTTAEVMNQRSLSASFSNNHSPAISLKDMPTDVLLRIVQLVADDQGILFTMHTLSQVCRRFHQFASVDSLNYKSLLWQRADLSALGRRMSTAVLHSRTLIKFPGLVALNLEGWPSLRDKDMEAICNAYGDTLAEVALGDSDHLSGKTLSALTSGCRQLRSVSLSRLSSKAVSGQLLIQLTSRHAASLASLTLDTIQCEIVGFDNFLSHLTTSPADCLPKLTHLRLAYLRPTGCRRVAICPTALSASLPALRELELVNIGQSADLDFLPPAKFTELRHILIQELKKPYRLTVSPSSLPRLTSLCVLSCDVDFSIGGCDFFTGLSRLVLAHCARLDDYVLTRLLKTSDQLAEVDFTCSATYDMSEYHEGIIGPSQNCFSQLHLLRQLKRLNLTGTSVIMHVVRDIATRLSDSLVELNLISCKRLPRGFKRRLMSREEIQGWLATEPSTASDCDAFD